MKSLFPKKSRKLIFIISSLFFISCENFMNGGDLKESIEEKVKYENSETFSVRIQADLGSGTITTGVGDKSVKVSDKIKVDFEAAPSYKFIKWTATDKETGADLSESVKFSNQTGTFTEIEILSQKNLLIKPLCYERPLVKEFSPANNQSGVEKNSTILITFNHPLSENNDLSRISVSINGNDVRKNFREPMFEDKNNKIKFLADKNNLLDVSGTQVVTVRIPHDFFYEVNGEKIEIGPDSFSDYSVSYTVNSTTNEKAVVEFVVPVNSGTISPNTTTTCSIGDLIPLKFTAVDSYQFCGWKIENGTGVAELSGNEEATVLKILDQSTENLIVSPVVYERPVLTEFSPFNSESVAKDSDIRLKFSKNLSEKIDLSGISITISGDNVSENFEKPQLKENSIIIAAKLDNPIPFTSGTRTVTVRIPSDFYYETEDGNKITIGTDDIQKQYTINTSSKLQAKVDFKAEGTGTISQEGTKTYNYGEEVELSFAENPAYQFIMWELKNEVAEDGSVVAEINDLKAAKTSLKIKGKSKENYNVEVKAVCAERPYISAFSPVNSAAEPSVAKNNPINITFSHSLELSEEDLKRIQITISDDDVKEHFKAPVVSGSTVSFAADNEKLIELASGTKTVRVTIPGDFYYLANKTDDYAGDKIYIGRETKKSYVINEKTEERTTVTFSAEANSGKITYSGNQLYNYGETVQIKFEESSTHKFLRWETSDSEKIVIENPTSPETTVTIKSTEKSGSFTVNAVCAERPVVTDYEPKYSQAGVERDTGIEITFNNEISKESFRFTDAEIEALGVAAIPENRLYDADGNCYGYKEYGEKVVFKNIKIEYENNSYLEYFDAPALNGKVLTIPAKNDSRIPVTQGATKKIDVTLGKGILDTAGNSIGIDKPWSYRVNSSTLTKLKVITVCDEGTGAFTVINPVYSMDEEFSISFNASDSARFKRWEYNEEYIRLADKNASGTTVKVLKAGNPALETTLKAVCTVAANLDRVEPEWNETDAVRIGLSKDSVTEGNDLLSVKGYSEWTQEDFDLNNRTFDDNGLKLWLYLNATDDNSGVYSCKVTETFVEDVKGNQKNTVLKTTVLKFLNANSEYSVCSEYDVNAKEDGIYRLDFSELTDRNENVKTETKSVYYVRDTSLDISSVKLSNSISNGSSDGSIGTDYESYYNKEQEKFELFIGDIKFNERFTKKVSAQIYYSDDFLDISHSLNIGNLADGKYSFTFDSSVYNRAFVDDIIFKVIVTDANNNEAFFTAILPRTPKVIADYWDYTYNSQNRYLELSSVSSNAVLYEMSAPNGWSYYNNRKIGSCRYQSGNKRRTFSLFENEHSEIYSKYSHVVYGDGNPTAWNPGLSYCTPKASFEVKKAEVGNVCIVTPVFAKDEYLETFKNTYYNFFTRIKVIDGLSSYYINVFYTRNSDGSFNPAQILVPDNVTLTTSETYYTAKNYFALSASADSVTTAGWQTTDNGDLKFDYFVDKVKNNDGYVYLHKTGSIKPECVEYYFAAESELNLSESDTQNGVLSLFENNKLTTEQIESRWFHLPYSTRNHIDYDRYGYKSSYITKFPYAAFPTKAEPETYIVFMKANYNFEGSFFTYWNGFKMKIQNTPDIGRNSIEKNNDGVTAYYSCSLVSPVDGKVLTPKKLPDGNDNIYELRVGWNYIVDDAWKDIVTMYEFYSKNFERYNGKWAVSSVSGNLLVLKNQDFDAYDARFKDETKQKHWVKYNFVESNSVGYYATYFPNLVFNTDAAEGAVTTTDYQGIKYYVDAGDTILCNFKCPTLVETYVSDVNWGESAKDWYYHTTYDRVLKPVEIKASKTYSNLSDYDKYEIPLDQILDGEYYTVVIHFSDGTMAKTSVHRK